MPDKIMPGPVDDPRGIREAVCIHTKKIYDSCRDKDCVEDLRFYPRLQYVDTINHALSVKGGTAKLLHVYVDVEPVTFNRGFYTIDMRFFYQVTLQAYLSCPIPVTVEGLCVFDKRVLLFGSEGSAKIFSSEFRPGGLDPQYLRGSNLPVAVVEAVDPIVLDAKLVESCGCRPCDNDLCEVPSFVSSFFDGELSSGDDMRRVYVTLGQFSIVRLERDSQLLIPVYDYCMPEKECSGGVDPGQDPCGLFRNICFPVGEFFPPNTVCRPETYEETRNYCSCCQ